VLLLNECLLLLLISLSTQSGNFWIHSRSKLRVGRPSFDSWQEEGIDFVSPAPRPSSYPVDVEGSFSGSKVVGA
jgi:hypothetical protein